MTFLVTIDGAGGGVKDLEYLIGSPHWQPPVILVEICIPMMPPGAYITDRRCISPVLPPASASARASYNSCVSIECFSCKIMPFFNFSHRLLQVIHYFL